MSAVQASFKEQAIVLRTTPLRESDTIAALLCENQGRLSALIRGARRSKKRFMGGIDLFDCGLFDLSSPRGNSELYNVSGIAQRTPFPALRNDLTKFSCSIFCLEIAALFTHESDPESSLFYLPLKDCLMELDRAEGGLPEPLVIAIRFMLRALTLSGFDAASRFESSSPKMIEWWKSLVVQGSQIALPKEDIIVMSVHTLTTFAEELQDKALRTKEGLLHCLRSYSEL